MSLTEEQLGCLAMATAEVSDGIVVIIATTRESEDEGSSLMGRVVCSHLVDKQPADVLHAIGLLAGVQQIAAVEFARAIGMPTQDLIDAANSLNAALPNVKATLRRYLDPPEEGGS